ncbi:uncharacterized protein PAN0_002c1220 [Moesziomyces antarcticus]|uniref:uncharacterized protein n=1 Tax=Pseudozyma antarctica TaxID=84753 RepID=UPI0007197E73|nr:uncharacterized protein PAN0_002c1220 [Moesziomyces antarcticus]GAK63018.1 hypothetical protein PAN0_002c1220 [Moesziomyces antarcticus]
MHEASMPSGVKQKPASQPRQLYWDSTPKRAGRASGAAIPATQRPLSEGKALSEGSGPDILKPDSHRASDGLKFAAPTRPLLDASRRLLLVWPALPPSQCIEPATRPSHVAVSQFGSPSRDEMKAFFPYEMARARDDQDTGVRSTRSLPVSELELLRRSSLATSLGGAGRSRIGAHPASAPLMRSANTLLPHIAPVKLLRHHRLEAVSLCRLPPLAVRALRQEFRRANVEGSPKRKPIDRPSRPALACPCLAPALSRVAPEPFFALHTGQPRAPVRSAYQSQPPSTSSVPFFPFYTISVPTLSQHLAVPASALTHLLRFNASAQPEHPSHLGLGDRIGHSLAPR